MSHAQPGVCPVQVFVGVVGLHLRLAVNLRAMELVDDTLHQIAFVLGVAIGQLRVYPREQVGGAEAVVVFETDDAGVHFRAEL